jgi:hypothetical protein
MLCEIGKNVNNTCAVLSEAYGGEATKKSNVYEFRSHVEITKEANVHHFVRYQVYRSL